MSRDVSTERAASPLRQVVDDIVTSLTKLADAEQAVVDEAPTVELPKADVTPLLQKYKRAEKRVAAAKEALEAAKADILAAMGGAELLKVVETQQAVVEHREVQSMVLDTARLRREQPQVAADYQRPRTQRPLRILV